MSENENNASFYGQPRRSEAERHLPLWQTEVLDRRRSQEQRNRDDNPAVWQKLMEIDAKLDWIIAALTGKSPTAD